VFFGQDLFKLNTQYTLKNTQMICLASDGVIGDMRKAEPVGAATSTQPRGENDLSFAFLLRFGSFRYYTGGDIDDAPGETTMEQFLLDQLKTDWTKTHMGRTPVPDFHACAIKVNHHGSANGTKAPFVDYFKPKVAVFSSGLQKFSSDFHPSEQVVKRLATDNKVCGKDTTTKRQQLFTFRIKSVRTLDANPMDNLQTSNKWKNLGIQDVILYVRKEAGGSPLNNLPPKIYMFRMFRMKSTYKPLSPTKPRPVIPPGDPTPTMPNEFAYDPTFIICDRKDDCTNKQHSVLPLPERQALILPTDLSLISLLRLFFNQP
jgi:hypothetical protein